MRVALKYCGGCDPAYERGPYFARIREAAGERIQWVRLEQDHYQAVLLICGCDTACPRPEMPPGVPLVCLTNDEPDPARVVERLLNQKGSDRHAKDRDQGRLPSQPAGTKAGNLLPGPAGG